MAHPRKLLRQGVVSILASDAGVTAIVPAARIYAAKVIPHKRQELPAIGVYTPSETVDEESKSKAPRELDREVDVEIELLVAGAADTESDVADALDDLAEAVEDAMHADPYLGGLVGGDKGSLLSSTELDLAPDGDRIIGLAFLTYECQYYTDAPAAPDDDALDDFISVTAEHAVNGAHEDETAVDDFDVQEAAS